MVSEGHLNPSGPSPANERGGSFFCIGDPSPKLLWGKGLCLSIRRFYQGEETDMEYRKLAITIALSLLITTGVLAGLNRGASLAKPLLPAPIEGVGALGAQDAVSTTYLVVRSADRDTIVRAITFTQPITAYRVLQLADLSPVVAETVFGMMLCGIDGVGQVTPDGTDCDNDTQYWGTAYWKDGAWAGRMVGVGQALIAENGHVEGFSLSDPSWTPVDPPPAPSFVAAADALGWLREQQQPDGSFGSPNGTADALLALGANQVNAATWRNGGPSLLANAIGTGTEFAGKNAAAVGKLATALAAQESYWPVDALRPLNYYSPMSGTYDSETMYHAWAILGTASLSETVPVSATDVLRDLQLPNGGWEWAAGWDADTNMTSVALQALIAAGEPVASTTVVSGLTYLKNAQNVDGGFTYSPGSPFGTDSDTNSTAYVVQALLSAGEDPVTGTWTISGTNPIDYLLSMQLPDGSFEWQPGYGANQFATQQAVPALLQRAFPIAVQEVDVGYGISGRVVSHIGGSEQPLAGVYVHADGAGDLFFSASDATGAYTISVPGAGSYVLTPLRQGLDFDPANQTAIVTGNPGDITTALDFVGEGRVYLPLALRG